jgi:hypothetical protein
MIGDRAARGIFAAFAAGAIVALAAACGGEREGTGIPSPGSTTSGTGSGGEGGTGAAGGGGAGAAGGQGGGGQGGGGGSGGGDLGSIAVVDVPDTGCESLIGSALELYPAASNPPAFSALLRVGSTRVAGGRFAGGFVTFGLDGSGPSPSPIGLDPDFNLVGAEETTLGLVASDGNSIRFQRYGANEQPMGAEVVLGSASGIGLGIAGAPGGSLAVWGTSPGMRARFVDENGGVLPAYDFGAATPGSGLVSSVTRASTDFAVLWSAKGDDGARSWFARLGPAAALAPEVDLTGAAGDHYVVKVVPTSGGYAALLNGGSPLTAAYLIFLDEAGGVVGPARHLLGATFGWDLAAVGGSVGVLAYRADKSTEFRPFSAAGDPLGDWKCLDGPSAQSFNLAAIDADGAGFAIVYRAPDGAERFVRTNATGTGAP